MRQEDLENLVRRAQQLRSDALRLAVEVRAAVDRALPPATRARVLGISRLVQSPAFQAALERVREDIRELEALYEKSPVAFVVDLLDDETGTRLLRADVAERDTVMIALFERALLERDHLDLIDDVLKQAPVLRDPQRQDLRRAIEMLRRRSVPWSSACRLLIGGYEGALWLWARDEKIIDEAREMPHRTPGRPPFARGVDRILEEDGLPLQDTHRRFVRERVFDELANDIRHGRATVGHRECALVLLFALGAWLDDQVGSQIRLDASARMKRHASQIGDDAEATE